MSSRTTCVVLKRWSAAAADRVSVARAGRQLQAVVPAKFLALLSNGDTLALECP